MAVPTDEGELLCRLTSQSFQAHHTLLLHSLPPPRPLRQVSLPSLGNPLSLPNQRNKRNNLYLHTFNNPFNNLFSNPSSNLVSPCISLYNSLFNHLANPFSNPRSHHTNHSSSQWLMERCLRCVNLASLQCTLLAGYLFPTFTLIHLALKVALVSSILSNRQLTLLDPVVLVRRLLLLIVPAVGPLWCSTLPTPLTLLDSGPRLLARMPL